MEHHSAQTWLFGHLQTPRSIHSAAGPAELSAPSSCPGWLSHQVGWTNTPVVVLVLDDRYMRPATQARQWIPWWFITVGRSHPKIPNTFPVSRWNWELSPTLPGSNTSRPPRHLGPSAEGPTNRSWNPCYSTSHMVRDIIQETVQDNTGIKMHKSAHTLAVKACLLGCNSATLNAQVTFVYIAVAISALAGGGP